MLLVRDLIEAPIFTSLLPGHHHRPIEEERVFLFLDVAGSTGFAERHGDLAAQRDLGAIFAEPASPVRRSGGSIDDHVGDMALVRWTTAQGTRDGASLRCVISSVIGRLSGSGLAVATRPCPAAVDDHPARDPACYSAVEGAQAASLADVELHHRQGHHRGRRPD